MLRSCKINRISGICSGRDLAIWDDGGVSAATRTWAARSLQRTSWMREGGWRGKAGARERRIYKLQRENVMEIATRMGGGNWAVRKHECTCPLCKIAHCADSAAVAEIPHTHDRRRRRRSATHLPNAHDKNPNYCGSFTIWIPMSEDLSHYITDKYCRKKESN